MLKECKSKVCASAFIIRFYALQLDLLLVMGKLLIFKAPIVERGKGVWNNFLLKSGMVLTAGTQNLQKFPDL